MSRTICLINGHPDASADRFCSALTSAYEDAAREAGHTVSRFDVGAMSFDFLNSAAEMAEPAPEAIRAVQIALERADHLTLIHPLWLGAIPAKAKALLEHVARDNFLIDPAEEGQWPVKRMRGKSARVIVTMGMPGFAYRLFLGSHSIKALEGGILRMAGFKPVRDIIFGMVDAGDAARRERMLAKVAALGARAA
ncbi:MAG: NAD(P)H-dependent oxidoreductase [Pseudomonadota bacterium]